MQLMLKHPHPDGKLLIVGGGIANFTDVYETFKGIIQAFQSFAKELREHKIKILVRRGGPNSEQGLNAMAALKKTHGLDIAVFGVDTTITSIVPAGLRAMRLGTFAAAVAADAEKKEESEDGKTIAKVDLNNPALAYVQEGVEATGENEYNLFTRTTVAIVYGIQPVAVQGSRFRAFFMFSCADSVQECLTLTLRADGPVACAAWCIRLAKTIFGKCIGAAASACFPCTRRWPKRVASTPKHQCLSTLLPFAPPILSLSVSREIGLFSFPFFLIVLQTDSSSRSCARWQSLQRACPRRPRDC